MHPAIERVAHETSLTRIHVNRRYVGAAPLDLGYAIRRGDWWQFVPTDRGLSANLRHADPRRSETVSGCLPLIHGSISDLSLRAGVWLIWRDFMKAPLVWRFSDHDKRKGGASSPC
jgi:hypothetical protein